MLVIPNVEKWTADKEFYDRKYLTYIKDCWTRQLNAYNKRLATVKTQKCRDKYLKWANSAYDALFKLDIIIEQL